MALDGDVEDGRAHADAVPVPQVHLGQPAPRRLLGALLPSAAPVLDAVHVGAVEAAQVAEPGLGRVDLEEEVMAGGRGVVGRQLGVAVGGPAEEERVVAVEGEEPPRERAGGDLQRHLRHSTLGL